MFRKYFFYLLFFQYMLVSAQTPIIHEQSQNESLLVRYYESPTPSQSISNYFIQEISKSIPKTLSYTQYTFSYNQYSRITKESDKEYGISIDLKDSKCSGDASYKGFDISDILFPAKIDFVVKVFYSNGQLLKTAEIKNVTLNMGFNKIINFKIQDDTAEPKYTISVENKFFYYADIKKKLFDKRQKQIDDYFYSDTIINVSLQKLQLINLQDIDMAQLNDIKLDEVEVMVEQLQNKKYSEKLKLLMYDPIMLMNKLADLNQQVKIKRVILNQMLSALDKLYYNKGCEYVLNNNIPMAIISFEKSIDINTFFVPSHYQLAKINYNSGNIDKSVEIIKRTFLNMYPDTNTRALIIQLSNNIYNSYLSKGQENIDGEKYNEAIALLTKAKNFCTTNSKLICTDNLQKKLSIAKYGIYHSFMIVATKSFEENKLELSENYTTNAKTYQQSNSNEIINSNEADTLINKVITAYIEKGIMQNAILNFEKALEYFNKIENLYKIFSQIPVNKKLKENICISKNGIYRNYLINASEQLVKNNLDKAESILEQAHTYQLTNSEYIAINDEFKNILNNIKHQQYLKIITDGEQLLLANHFDSALVKFEKARLLETTYTFEKNAKLDSIIQKVIKPLLLEDIVTGKIKAWGNALAKAHSIYADVITKQEKYKLGEDAELNKELTELKDKIFAQERTNAQNEYDNNYQKAQEHIKNKKFIDAMNMLYDAIKVTINNAMYNISAETANNAKIKYSTPANYQKLLNEADALLSEKKYAQAIEKYQDAEKYFVKFSIHNFGLPYPTLYNYISTQNNSDFISYCVNYYTEQKNCDSALLLLKLLKQQNCPLNNSRTLQENIGIKLAERDYQKNPALNPKTNILIYTNGDEWFKYLKIMYIKMWRKL